MTAWVRVEESEGFTPPDAGAFDLPPLFDNVEWLTKPVLQIVLSVVIISVFFLLNVAFPLGFLFIAFDYAFMFRADRRCLHDLIAGTRVVRV